MPRVVITHDVVEIEAWLKGKSERADAIAGIGGSNVVDHAAQDGSNSIAVTCDVADVGSVIAAIANPPAEMAEAMQRHGVVPPLTVYVER